jgi:tetratricopeptide (TPR) repeat protein
MFAAKSNVEKANTAYSKELYNQALELYLKAAKDEGTSSELYYNIGNTYYRLKENGNAILYYERALLLNPGNSKARTNLEFVKSKAQIHEDDGVSFFSNLIDGIVSHKSSNTWAVIGIVSFLLFLGACAVYFFVSGVVLRKIGFFGGGLLLIISILANVCAFHMHDKAVNRNEAIVMVPSATLSSAPRVPKDKSEVAFLLNEGYKVELLDSIQTKNGLTVDKWYDVETIDSHRAWINAKDIKII